MARTGPLRAVSWLPGFWASDSAQEVWAVHHKALVGLNRSGDQVELLRIEADRGELVYTAAPPGQAITAFRARPEAPVHFDNPHHDFPKRITYAREGPERFTATISGDAGDRQASWTFTRLGDPPRVTRARGTITADLDALTVHVEIPERICAQLECAVLPTAAGPTLQVAIIDTYLDCMAPASGTCALPARSPLPRVGAATLTAPTWQGPIPYLAVEPGNY